MMRSDLALSLVMGVVLILLVILSRWRCHRGNASPVAMDTRPSLPPELWERTPPAIRAYIERLEGQVKTLTSMVHTLQEQVRTLEEWFWGALEQRTGLRRAPLATHLEEVSIKR